MFPARRTRSSCPRAVLRAPIRQFRISVGWFTLLLAPGDEGGGVSELPSGTVTFLFTDVEGSSRLWEDYPDVMHDVLARHDEIVRGAIESHDGYVVKTTGDGFHAAFSTARDGLEAALAAQQGLAGEPPVQGVVVKVRMGVHTGEARVRDGDYYGAELNRAARLMAVGHGGQVLVSEVTHRLGPDVAAVDLGSHQLKDVGEVGIWQLTHPSLPA